MPNVIYMFGLVKTLANWHIVTMQAYNFLTTKLVASTDLLKSYFTTSFTPGSAQSSVYVTGGRALNPEYVTGLSDGDGHFGININRAAKKVSLEYKITSHCASLGLLKDLLAFFGIGRINIDNRGDNTMKFVVSSLQHIISVIIPHFEAYPLQGSKHLNFLAFKEAALLMNSGAHLTEAPRGSPPGMLGELARLALARPEATG
jgi:hypothetical protein